MTHQEAFDEINKTQDEYIDQLISLMNNKDYEMMQMLNFTSPTGTGKTNMMAKLINKFPNYYFIVTTLSKGQLHIQIRNNLKKLVDRDNFYVYGSADYRINSKLDAKDIISKIPSGSKCIWLRDEGHIRTNRWDELLLEVCYKVINFSATNTHSDIQCNFTSTMMLRTVNQTNGTPEDAINKLLEIKKAHKNVHNYNPCAIFRCVSGDKKLYQMIIDLCNKYHLKYIDITEDEYVMQQLCEDNNENDVIINKFKIVEGIDIRRAHVLYMDNQPGNNATTIQVIGRCRRNALLYRDDIDILSPENENLLNQTRECYVYYNVEKMRIDEDENGELQYAFCNYISCQALKPNSIIEVKDGQLSNGLHILELENETGIFKVEIDPITGFNVINPNTNFYNLSISKCSDYIYVSNFKFQERFGSVYGKILSTKLNKFLAVEHKFRFSYAKGEYSIEEKCDPYFDCHYFKKEITQKIYLNQDTINYFNYLKQQYLNNLQPRYIENVIPMNKNSRKKTSWLSLSNHASLIDVVNKSNLPYKIKNLYIEFLHTAISDPSIWLLYEIDTHTIDNDIKVEALLNDISDFIINNKIKDKDAYKLVEKYLTLIYSVRFLFGFSIPKYLSTIMNETNIINNEDLNITIKAGYNENYYNLITNVYYDDSINITKTDINNFFENLTAHTKCCSIKNKKQIINNVKDIINSIEQNLIDNCICTVLLDYMNLVEPCTADELYLINNGYCSYYKDEIPLSKINYKSYTKINNDKESSIIGTDLMKQFKTDSDKVIWIESRSVSSKIGNYNKFNSFLSQHYKDELDIAKSLYVKGKNEFKLDKKCNSVIGYCVEYYSKYLIYGKDYLGTSLNKAMLESKTNEISDAIIIRACILKYKENIACSFGSNAAKIIQTISINQLIKEDYQEFIILVKTLGQRVAKFVKEYLYKDNEPINDIDPNLTIRHIAGLADYITEDTILDVKVRGGIGEGEVRQVLAYHYLSTKRSDLHINRVIVYDATSGRSVIVPISEKNQT